MTAKGFVYTGKKIEYTPVAADVGKLITITFAARIPYEITTKATTVGARAFVTGSIST